MKRRLLILIAASFSAIFWVYVGLYSFAQSIPSNGLQYYGISSGVETSGVSKFVNKERVSHNLAPLARNAKLDKAAAAKCADMVAKGYWSHNDPSGRTPWHFITESDYSYQTAGENLADGWKSSKELVKGWMNSPKHKENILKAEFTEVGYAKCQYGSNSPYPGTLLVVQYFAQPYSVK